MHGLRLRNTVGAEFNSTTIQCVYEQILTGICIFPEFNLLPMDHLCTKSLTKTKILRA